MAPEFLPPDPYADAPEAPRAAHEPPAADTGRRVKLSLALGAASLGGAALTYGALFALTLPAAVAALIVGRRARSAQPRPQYADAAVILGVVATVVSLLAAVLWVIALANGDSLFDDGNGNSDVTFEVARALAAAR